MANMKIKKYECIIDDGEHLYREYIPALNKKDLMARWGGNGDFVQIKEVPDYLPDAARVRDDLARMGYGKAEQDFVYRILSNYVEGTE